MSKAEARVVSIKTQYRFNSTSDVFKVDILQNVKGETVKTEITEYAKPSAADVFEHSGDIDVSKYSGVIYLGFYYYEPVSKNCRTWRVDDILMGKSSK